MNSENTVLERICFTILPQLSIYRESEQSQPQIYFWNPSEALHNDVTQRQTFAFDKPLHTSPLRRILDPRIVTIYANQKCSRLSRSWKTTPNPPKRNQKLYIHPRNAMPAARKRGNVGACPRQIFVTRRSARGPYWCFSLSSTFSTSSPMKTKWCFTTPKPFCHCGHVLRD